MCPTKAILLLKSGGRAKLRVNPSLDSPLCTRHLLRANQPDRLALEGGGEGQGQDRGIVSLMNCADNWRVPKEGPTVRNHYPALVPLGTLDSGAASTGVMPSA